MVRGTHAITGQACYVEYRLQHGSNPNRNWYVGVVLSGSARGGDTTGWLNQLSGDTTWGYDRSHGEVVDWAPAGSVPVSRCQAYRATANGYPALSSEATICPDEIDPLAPGLEGDTPDEFGVSWSGCDTDGVVEHIPGAQIVSLPRGPVTGIPRIHASVGWSPTCPVASSPEVGRGATSGWTSYAGHSPAPRYLVAARFDRPAPGRWWRLVRQAASRAGVGGAAAVPTGIRVFLDGSATGSQAHAVARWLAAHPHVERVRVTPAR